MKNRLKIDIGNGPKNASAWLAALRVGTLLAQEGRWDGQERIMIFDPFDTNILQKQKGICALREGEHYAFPDRKLTEG